MAELYIGKVADFGEKDRKIVAQGELEIGVFRLNGEFFAWENNCVHQGGPVCQGKILNRVEEILGADKTSKGLKFSETEVHIICPWHGYEYNIKTGRHPGDKNVRLKPYEVKVKNGEVYVLV